MSETTPRAFLRYRLPGEPPRTQVLEADETTLGRDRAAGLSLPFDEISRLHARIQWDGRRHFVEDLGSTNGTRVNGRLARRHRLRDLDVVSLAKGVDLLFLTGRSAERIELEGVVQAWLEPLATADPARVEISAGELTLGRSAGSCNVVVEHERVSKVHARVERQPAAVYVEDLGSANGTTLNERPVARARLRDGDEIGLAGVVAYRVRIETGRIATAASVAPSAPAMEDGEQTIVRRFDAEWRAKLEAASEEAQQPERPQDGDARRILVVRLEGGGRYLAVTAAGAHEIGRTAALHLDHPTVSRRHARLTLAADRRQATLADLGATHPARLNGRAVVGGAETALRDGDRVEFGDVVLTVRFVRE
ncbi:MAG: FHA domain-containing protein [Vicinamibacteria bacterium]|nr:FHA domain-containing protein [Vicinamibacteria bacterium]